MTISTRIAGSIKRASRAVSGWMGGVKTKVAVGIRWALSMGTPGRWASDHREESTHLTGWTYVAIHALAVQAMQADVAIFADGPSQGSNPGSNPAVAAAKRDFRKSMRRMGKKYKHDSRSGKQLPEDHRLVKLMKRPNPGQSGALFRYEQIIQLQVTGTCIVWNCPNKAGLPVERYVVPTCMCYPVPPSRDLPRGGWRIDGTMNRFAYPVDADGFSQMQGLFAAMGYVLPAEQCQVIRWPHPVWKDDGYGPLAAGSLWVDTAEQIDQSRWASLKQGPNPSLVITGPPDWNPSPEDIDEQQSAFNEKYAGPDKAGKAIFVGGGVTVEGVGHNAREMDFVGSWPQARDCILALHGTPPVAVGIAGDGSYAALYAGLKQYVTLTVQPVLDMLAESDTEHFLPFFGEGLTAEWSAASIDDPQLVDAQIANAIAGECITKGELRGILGLEPFGDARDDEIAKAAVPPPPGGGLGAAAKPGGAKPAAGKPKKPKPQPAQDEADETTTGVKTPGGKRPKVPKSQSKHFNQLMGDPVLKAAVEGALSGVRSEEEAVELGESWKYNGAV